MRGQVILAAFLLGLGGAAFAQRTHRGHLWNRQGRLGRGAARGSGERYRAERSGRTERGEQRARLLSDREPAARRVSGRFSVSGFKTVNRTGVRVGLGQQIEESRYTTPRA